MPAINIETSSPFCEVVTSARGLSPKALSALQADPVKANLILPTYLKARAEEQKNGLPNPENTWFVCYDSPARSRILYVASLTKGMTGDYPLFIFTTASRSSLVKEDVEYAMEIMAEAIDLSVSRERVYSVFAVDLVAAAFSVVWSKRTGIEFYTRPYYDSTISFCSKRDIIQSRQDTVIPGIQYDLCPATWEDIPEIGRLCEMFAAESVSVILVQQR
jgi:hypothetical protein